MKYFLNKNNLKSNVKFTFFLDSDIKPTKILKSIGDYEIDTPNNSVEPTYITGYTTSKFNFLLKSMNNVVLGHEFKVKNTNIWAKIIQNSSNIKKYILYTNTDTPIEYVDYPNNITIFKYKRTPQDNKVGVFLLEYNDIIEEPKIISNLFIDRGVNNVFDPVKRLKHVKNNIELEKAGFDFYTIRKNGNINN